MALPWPASGTAQEADGGTVSPPVGSAQGECARGRAGVASGCVGNRATGVQGWELDGVPSAQRLCGFLFFLDVWIRVTRSRSRRTRGYTTRLGDEAHAVPAVVPGGRDHVWGGLAMAAIQRAHDVEQTPKNMFTPSAPSAYSTHQLNSPATQLPVPINETMKEKDDINENGDGNNEATAAPLANADAVHTNRPCTDGTSRPGRTGRTPAPTPSCTTTGQWSWGAPQWPPQSGTAHPPAPSSPRPMRQRR